MAVAGIDCGKDGGIVVIGGPSFAPELTLYIMPMLGAGRRAYDLQRMRAILCSHTIDQVFLERQQAMKSRGKFDGSAQAFSSGEGYGLWQGLLAGLRIPFETVSPQTWQAAMFKGVVAGDTKAKSALVCQRLHPRVDWRRTARCKGPHEGLADALCIVEWGRRQMALRSGSAA